MSKKLVFPCACDCGAVLIVNPPDPAGDVEMIAVTVWPTAKEEKLFEIHITLKRKHWEMLTHVHETS